MMFYFTQCIELLFFIVSSCFATDFDILQDAYFMRQEYKEININKSLFNYLENYHVNALNATEEEFPWVARVVHSRTQRTPHMCTAACIDKHIFITAARCIFNLKVKYTRVVYKSKWLPVRAFVLPSYPTVQKFDDIGFIVIERKSIVTYSATKLFDEVNRTDEAFQWFSEMDLSGEYKVVGYAVPKGPHRNKIPEREYDLKQLFIAVGFDICPTILTVNHRFENEGFNVPCYHSCTLPEFKKKTDECSNYHGVEGGAVIDTRSNRLFGLATWGTYFHKYELPVGFSVINSKNFYQDYVCARKIRDSIAKAGYQTACV